MGFHATRLGTVLVTMLAAISLVGAQDDKGKTTSEESTPPLTLSWGGMRTELEQTAVRFALSYFKDLPTLWNAGSKKVKPPGSKVTGYFTMATPEVEIKTGSKDSFDGIVAKVAGYHFRGGTEKVGEIPVLKCHYEQAEANQKSHHNVCWAIPFAGGIEADRNFRNVNALVEAGVKPLELREGSNFKLGFNPIVGVFVQGGYKYGASGSTQVTPPEGGAQDQSEEKPDSWLLRLKCLVGFNQPLGDVLVLSGDAAGWYDIANSATYYQIALAAKLKYYKNQSFDLTYEKGAGPPTFNKGDQFGASLTFAF